MTLRADAERLLLIVLLLAITAFAVVKMHNIVKFESGLDNTEILRRMWSKADRVLFQPPAHPLALSVFVGVGLRYTLEFVLLTILQIMDVQTRPQAISAFAMSILCLAISVVFAVVVYRMVGGQSQEKIVGALLVIYLGLYGFRLWSEPGPFGPVEAVVWILGITLVTVLCGMSAIRYQLPVYHVEPAVEVATPKSWWLWSGLLVLLCASGDLIHRKLARDTYLGLVTVDLAQMALLFCCAFVSCWTTNRSVMNGNYHWKWRSVYIVGVPVAAFQTAAFVYDVVRTDDYIPPSFHRHLLIALRAAACGFAGSVAYLAVVAKYAHRALDPGYEGQSELLEDDDDFEV